MTRYHCTWEITLSCNFNCDYCSNGHINHLQRVTYIPFDGFLEGLRKAKDTEWDISITGGEPFVVPDFVEGCVHLTKSHRLELFSNLSLTSKIRDFSERISPDRVINIIASFHMEMREELNSVDEFINNCLILQNVGIPVWPSQVLHPSLIGKFKRYRDRFQDKGLQLIPLAFNGTHESRSYPQSYTIEDLEILNTNPAYERGLPLPHVEYNGKPCRAGNTHIVVRPDGGVHRCAGIGDSIGNILTGVQLRDEPYPCTSNSCPCPLG